MPYFLKIGCDYGRSIGYTIAIVAINNKLPVLNFKYGQRNVINSASSWKSSRFIR